MKNNIVLSTVVAFRPRLNRWQGGYAVLTIPGVSRQFTVSDKNGPFTFKAEDGMSVPEITTERFTRTPKVSESLAVQFDGSKTANWGFGDDWEKAQSRIADLIKSRPARSQQFMARFRKAMGQNPSRGVSPAMPKRTTQRPFRTVLLSTSCTA